MVFSLVAYKPDATLVTGGWVQARYASDFHLHVQLDEQELLDHWAQYLFQDHARKGGDARWELYVLYEGRLLWEEDRTGIEPDDTRDPQQERALLDYSVWLYEQARERSHALAQWPL